MSPNLRWPSTPPPIAKAVRRDRLPPRRPPQPPFRTLTMLFYMNTNIQHISSDTGIQTVCRKHTDGMPQSAEIVQQLCGAILCLHSILSDIDSAMLGINLQRCKLD
ncbi:GTP cyclohydrolase 1 [Iris pallida]|uniref:GTP cyclohydrolase 1 n=1 Tax=Iris pallida TaxID=29817 RepID=A0AAX6F3C5_IRIPA|nr:GTP cyclohydrolase 1 [Iris pallida]